MVTVRYTLAAALIFSSLPQGSAAEESRWALGVSLTDLTEVSLWRTGDTTSHGLTLNLDHESTWFPFFVVKENSEVVETDSQVKYVSEDSSSSFVQISIVGLRRLHALKKVTSMWYYGVGGFRRFHDGFDKDKDGGVHVQTGLGVMWSPFPELSLLFRYGLRGQFSQFHEGRRLTDPNPGTRARETPVRRSYWRRQLQFGTDNPSVVVLVRF